MSALQLCAGCALYYFSVSATYYRDCKETVACLDNVAQLDNLYGMHLILYLSSNSLSPEINCTALNFLCNTCQLTLCRDEMALQVIKVPQVVMEFRDRTEMWVLQEPMDRQ